MDQICPMRQSLPANLYKKFAYNYNTHSRNTYTPKKPTKEKRKKKKEKVSKRMGKELLQGQQTIMNKVKGQKQLEK